MADWKCSRCEWINREFVNECISCGAGRGDVAEAVNIAERAARGGATLAGSAPEEAVGPLPASAAPPLRGSGLFGGLVAGAIAATLATVIWYAVVVVTEYEIGFVAIVVGWLVGTAVVFGSRRRVSIPLVGASALFTLAALSVSEYLIVYHVLTEQLGVPLGLIEAPEFIIEVAIETIRAEPVTLLFWGIALVQAVYIPFRVMRPATTGPGPRSELDARAT